MSRSISTFSEFWPYYLGEHRNPLCRILHFVGTATFIGIAVWVIGTRDPGDLWMVLLAPIPAYGLAWTGHFLIEKNRPATFTYPLWSLLADETLGPVADTSAVLLSGHSFGSFSTWAVGGAGLDVDAILARQITRLRIGPDIKAKHCCIRRPR